MLATCRMSAVSCLLPYVGAGEGREPIKKEAVAFLLPAAITYLQQLYKAAVPVHNAAPAAESASESAMSASRQARTTSDGNSRATQGPGDIVRAFFAEQVTEYMTAKPKAPQGAVPEAI